jgi:hypothetical protein
MSLSKKRCPLLPLQQIRTNFSIYSCIRGFSPDVIHLQQGHLWFNFALPFLARYPLLLTIHDPKHHHGDRGGQKTLQAIMDFGFHRVNRKRSQGQR